MPENIDFVKTTILVIVLVISVVGHEIAHGYAAYKFGDLTAKNLGRLSINPIKHIDLMGTIIVPALMYLSTGITFGWAKPVPINLRVVLANGGYKAAIIVALAGIAYNFTLAATALFALKSIGVGTDEIFVQFLFMFFVVNLVLGLFNLYPIPPLDGSKALEYILRILNFHKAANLFIDYARYGFIVLIVLIISPAGDYVFAPIRWAVRFLIGD